MKDECEKFASDLEKNRKVLEDAKLTAQVGPGEGGGGECKPYLFHSLIGNY